MPSFAPRNVFLCVVPAVVVLLTMFWFKKKKKKLVSNPNPSTIPKTLAADSQTSISVKSTSSVDCSSPVGSASSIEVASDSSAFSDASMSSPEFSIKNDVSIVDADCSESFTVTNVIESVTTSELPIEKDKVYDNHTSFIKTKGKFEVSSPAGQFQTNDLTMNGGIVNESFKVESITAEMLSNSSNSFDDRFSSYVSCDEQNNELITPTVGLSNGLCSEISSDFSSEDQQNSNLEDNAEDIVTPGEKSNLQSASFIKILNDGSEVHFSLEKKEIIQADSHSSVLDEYSPNSITDESEKTADSLSKDSPSSVLDVNGSEEFGHTGSSNELLDTCESEGNDNCLDHVSPAAKSDNQTKEQYSVQLNRNSFFASTLLSSGEISSSTTDGKVSNIPSSLHSSSITLPEGQSKMLDQVCDIKDAMTENHNQQALPTEAKPFEKYLSTDEKSDCKIVSSTSDEDNSCAPSSSCTQAKRQSETAVSCDTSVSCFIPESMTDGDLKLEQADSISSFHSSLSDPYSMKSIENQLESLSQSKIHGIELGDGKSAGMIPGLYIYEFDLPQELCGRLIGRQGKYVKSIKERTNANILIKRHPFDNNLKTVVVEGSRAAVFEALDVIRRKFPPSQFPQVTLIQTNMMSSPAVPLPESLQLHLPEGASCDVILSSLVSAGHFFLQQPTHPTYPSLTTLDQCMITCYSQMDTPMLPHPVEAGVICAAPVMNGWFRAQVIYVYEARSECQIKFVDYGGFSQVATSSLRQIRSDFMTLPFQASECYLANVRPVDRNAGWSAEATAVFEELAQGQILQALVVEYAEDGIPCVQLYKVQGISNMFINQELVERGLAVWVESGHWDPH